MGSIVYMLVKRYGEAPLEWEVLRVEDGDIAYSEARFARRDDAEAFLDKLKRWEKKA